MGKITITFVHHRLKRGGGSEQVLYDLIHGLDKERFRPVLCCLYNLGALGEQLQAEGCDVYQNLIRTKYDPRNVFKVASILRSEQADILYVTDAFHNVVLGRLAAALAHTPVSVIGFHCFDQIIRKASTRRLRVLLLELTDRILLPHFHKAIALAETHKQYVTTVKHLPESKVSVIYNGIDVGKFGHTIDVKQVRRYMSIPEQAQVVGIVAGLRPWKTHETFLAAAAEVLREAPTTYFVIAGDGPRRIGLERMAQELGLNGHVRFLGLVDDVPTLLKALDLSVLSSVHEVFPITLLESMAAGKPVVSTDVGSVSDIVEDGVNGFLVPPGAPERLAEAMLRVLRQPELGRRFGEAGRKKVEQHFTVERMVRRYEALFTEWTNATRVRYATEQFRETA